MGQKEIKKKIREYEKKKQQNCEWNIGIFWDNLEGKKGKMEGRRRGVAENKGRKKETGVARFCRKRIQRKEAKVERYILRSKPYKVSFLQGYVTFYYPVSKYQQIKGDYRFVHPFTSVY